MARAFEGGADAQRAASSWQAEIETLLDFYRQNRAMRTYLVATAEVPLDL